MSLFYRIAFVAARFLVVDGQVAPDDPANPTPGSSQPGTMHSYDPQRPALSRVVRQGIEPAPMLGTWWDGRPDRRAGRQ